MRVVEFAIVGLGMIGSRHKQHITENQYAHLAAVCDIRSREDIGLESDVPLYSTIDQMLAEHPEIEAVSICTPNSLHAKMATEVINAGRRPIVEKPLALTKEDALMVANAAKSKEIEPFMVMQNRYSPPSVWLKEILEKQLLGKLCMVTVNCFWNRDERYYKPGHWHGSVEQDGGVLYSQFSHFIDLLLWFLQGDVKVTGATMANMVHDGKHQRGNLKLNDTGVINFRASQANEEDDVIGVMNFSTAVWQKNLESSITFIGDKGTVKVAGQYMNEVVECNIDGYEMPELAPCNAPNNYGPYKGSAANHCYVIDNVVNTLNGMASADVKVEEGCKVVNFIVDAYNKAK